MSVCKYALDEIEKRSDFPDLLVILTEQYPFREEELVYQHDWKTSKKRLGYFYSF